MFSSILKMAILFLFINAPTLSAEEVICPEYIKIKLEVPEGFRGNETYSQLNFIGSHFISHTLSCYYGAGRMKIDKEIKRKHCQLKTITVRDPAIKNSPMCLGNRLICSVICS